MYPGQAVWYLFDKIHRYLPPHQHYLTELNKSQQYQNINYHCVLRLRVIRLDLNKFCVTSPIGYLDLYLADHIQRSQHHNLH